MSLRLVSVKETDSLVISRYESDDGGALTIYREKEPAPAIKLHSPLASMHNVGSLEVARLEANAATDGDAADIATAWDQQWGSR